MAMMEMLEKYRHDTDIEKTIFYKNMMAYLTKYPAISKKYKTDQDLFRLDIIVHALKNKEKKDDIFKQYYIENNDILNRLNYQEKKHLLIQEIKQHTDCLYCFDFEGEKIYLPIFDMKINHFYMFDRPLLELKQYQKYIDNFSTSMIDPISYYGYELYQSCFSSLQYIIEDERFICYYLKDFGCVYVFNKETMTIASRLFLIDKYSSLDSLTYEQVCIVVDYYLHYQFKECIDYLYASQSISQKVYRKILKKYQ